MPKTKKEDDLTKKSSSTKKSTTKKTATKTTVKKTATKLKVSVVGCGGRGTGAEHNTQQKLGL